MFNDVLYQVLDKLKLPILILNPKMKPEYCNLAFFELADYKDSSSFKINHILPNLDLSDISKTEFSTEMRTSTGATFLVDVRVETLDQDYRLLTFVQTDLSGDFFHARRLETLGVLAGSVAHDFNNILAGILGHVSFLQNVLPEEGKHATSLSSIEEGSKKASMLTKEILHFSRRSVNEDCVAVDLNSISERTITLLLGSLRPQSSVEFSSDHQNLSVMASEVNISQILVNLIVNAHDAIQEAGSKDNTIKVSLVLCKQGEHPDSLESDNKDQEYAILQVIDSGSGMDAETMEKAFTPYFSTKADQGTGLGLPTVSAIVKRLGGEIQIDSKIGKGTTISVYLPIVKDQASTSKRSDSSELTASNPEKHILVVDDEEVVRTVLDLNLKQLGYQVTIMESPEEAILDYENQKELYDLVILDMLMPGMSGEEFFHKMRQINSKQEVILISGFCSDDTIEALLDEGNCYYLSKPFTIESLAEQLEEIFNNG